MNARASWRWNSQTLEAAVAARGVATNRRTPFQFDARGLSWWHTSDPTLGAQARNRIRSKPKQRQLLVGAGVRVPAGILARTVAEVVRFADGRPVAIKPPRGAKGDRVSVGVADADVIGMAVRVSGLPCLVERQVFGDDLRIFAFADGPIAACRREPPFVVGDGCSTVSELVAAENRRRQSPTYESLPEPRRGGVILADGQREVLSLVANVSAGGVSHNATDQLDGTYEEAGRVAAAAVSALGLKHGGVDLVGTTVLEVNHAASMRVHLHPAFGEVVRVDSMLAERYYP